MADVDFLFDFISPYTYLARTQLDGIAARTGARFRMWPMHILNLMKTVGNTPTTVVCSNKRKYAGQMVRSVSSSPEAQSASYERRSQPDLERCTCCAGNESGRPIQWRDVFRVLD